jgi:hypothetical protein
MSLVCESRRSCFAAEADIIVEIKGVEPGFDVFPGLAVLPNVFSEAGESFSVAARSTLVEIRGPSLDFPR